MKKRLLLYFALITSISISAQTQQGYVRTLGRPDKKGEALGGVTIRARGEHNTVLSEDDGTFSIPFHGLKNGDAFSLQQVQKNGYELNEIDIVGRHFAFSDKVKLEIVMVSTQLLQSEKQRIEEIAYQTAEKNYKAKYKQLETMVNESRISADQYRKQLADLQAKFEKYQSLIDGLAEHYVHTDYDLLNEKDREINICIENGELERADSLIRLLFDPTDVLKHNKENLAHIDQQIGEANDIIARANEEMAAILKQQEKDAEYLYQLYTIALAKFDNEKAQNYIQTRAELDTTKPNWQFDAGFFLQEHNDFVQAKKYYSRALEAYRQLTQNNPQAYEPDLASTINNLAILYKNTQHLAESETMYLQALEIYRRLAKEKHKYRPRYRPSIKYTPKNYEPDVARTLNNLALLYCNTQRLHESETMYLEAIEIRRRLADEEPAVYEPDLAMTLNNLAILYMDMKRVTESESLQLEAMEIQKRLANHNPQAYEPDLARTMNNLAVLYANTQRPVKSRSLHLEALVIFKRLAKDNPQTYEPALATTLNNLADSYLNTHQFNDSEKARLEALEIIRRWARSNPQIYEHSLALTLNNLAFTYENTQNLTESETLYLEALEIYRRLAADKPQDHEPDMATTLYHLADIYLNTQRLSESEALFLDALEINRRLAKDSSLVNEAKLVATLSSLAVLYYKTQRLTESENMYLEAAEIYRHLARKDPQVYETRLANTLYSIGLLYWRQDQYIQAIPVFEEAVVLYKNLVQQDDSYQKWYENSLQLLTQLYRETEQHAKFFTVNGERLVYLKERYQNGSKSYKQDYVSTLGEQSHQGIFVGQLEQSEQYAREAFSIDSTQQRIFTNLAAALLFQGKYDEAEAIYRQCKDESKDSFLQDFIDFEAAGVIPEERKADVERIKKLLTE